MASEIRVNQIQSRTGVSTISFTETGPIISGVTTITGDLDVTGLVSYDDVTNIDSVGVVTARDGLQVTGGSVGIGTDNPSNLLHVYGQSRFEDYLRGDSTHNKLYIADDVAISATKKLYLDGGSNTYIDEVSADALRFTTGGSERLRIKSDGKAYFTGNLGLGGQTSPASTIHINDLSANGYELKVTGNAVQFNRSSNSYIDQLHDTGSILFRMTSSHTEAMRITSAGDMGLGSSSPNHYNNYTTLTINGTTGGELDFESGGTLIADAFANSSGYFFTTRTAIPIRFYTTNSGGAHAERLRITSGGNIGINQTSPNAPLSFNTGTGQKIELYNSGSGNEFGLGVENSELRISSGTSSVIAFRTGGYNGAERVRIDAGGTLLVNAAIDNSGGHGRIVAHAPTSGNTIYKAIEIGNTDGSGTGRGAAICGQPKSNSHLPYTLIGSWDHGDNTDVYYGGGWGGAMRPATRHRFYTNSSYPTSGESGTENMTLNGNGHLTLPNHPSFGCIKNGHQYPVNGQRTIITPWTEHFDQGGHFNATTGVFTAPVQGKYYFYVSAMMDRNDNGDYQIAIYRNGSLYYNSNDMLSNSGVTYMQTTICGVVEMSANDTVDFRMYNSSATSSYIYQNHYTHCGGYLIG